MLLLLLLPLALLIFPLIKSKPAEALTPTGELSKRKAVGILRASSYRAEVTALLSGDHEVPTLSLSPQCLKQHRQKQYKTTITTATSTPTFR